MARTAISIIIPCLNEEAALPSCYEELKKIADSMPETDFEFCLVDDGSVDGTLDVIRRLSAEDRRVRYLSFSRNFGKEAAMLAGLRTAGGDYCVLMDADLQHPPRLIADMYAAVKNGEYDIAAAQRVTRRGEPRIKSFFARCFYGLIRKISDMEIVDGATDFCLMSRTAVNAVLSLNEYNRFFKGILNWVGFRKVWIPYENVERIAGRSKWSIRKLIRYSVGCITDFTVLPLMFSFIAGLLSCLAALILFLVIIIRSLVSEGLAAGCLLIAALILLMGGLILFSIGILGQYVSKMYLELKGRPHYIVRETEKGQK